MEWHRLSKKPRNLVSVAFRVTKDLHLEVKSTHTSPPVSKVERCEAASEGSYPSTALGLNPPFFPSRRPARSDHTPQLEACPGKMRYRENKSNSGES